MKASSLSPYTDQWTESGRWVVWQKDEHKILADNFATEFLAWTWIDTHCPDDANGVSPNVRPEYFDY